MCRPRGMTDLALHAGPVASLSGPIVDFCVNEIDDTGLAGVFFLGPREKRHQPQPAGAGAS